MTRSARPVHLRRQVVGYRPRFGCAVVKGELVRWAMVEAFGRAVNGDAFAGTRRSVRLSRMLVVLMGLVVLSFLTAYVAGRLRGRTIDHDLAGIVDNAMPSVVQLSSARGDLHRLDGYVDAYADAAAEGVAMPVEPLTRYRRDADSALEQYYALPTFPGERETGEDLPAKLTAIDAAVARVLSAVDGRDARAAENALQDEQRSAEEADMVLERLIELNAREGRNLGLAIRFKRQRAIRTVTALDGTAVLLSLAAAMLAAVILRRSVRTLEDQTDELSNFAGRVAHDVTSPLSSLGLSLQILGRRTVDDPTSQATAKRGLASVQRASRIVQDLLEFSRAGARPDPTASADLKSVVDDVVEGLRLEALAARVQVRCHVHDSCAVACSPGVLTSLVSNIVRNAVKHMGDSPLRLVDVGVVDLGDRRRVEVADTGPGIASSVKDQIFEPFVRGETASPGVGLGLATVRRLAEAHHGRADFRSEIGRGSVFWFEIPVAPRPVGRLATRFVAAGRARWRGLRSVAPLRPVEGHSIRRP